MWLDQLAGSTETMWQVTRGHGPIDTQISLPSPNCNPAMLGTCSSLGALIITKGVDSATDGHQRAKHCWPHCGPAGHFQTAHITSIHLSYISWLPV